MPTALTASSNIEANEARNDAEHRRPEELPPYVKPCISSATGRIRISVRASKSTRVWVALHIPRGGGKREQVQVTEAQAGSAEDARSLIEFLGHSLISGMSKDEVVALRNKELSNPPGERQRLSKTPEKRHDTERAAVAEKYRTEKANAPSETSQSDSGSDSSTSSSTPDNKNAAPSQEQPRKYVRASAKMAVRTGLRCWCHYMTDCPSLSSR